MPSTNRPESPARFPRASVAAVKLSIPVSASACERARRLAGRTLEVADAPKLPLRDCGRMDCQCRYSPVVDRRRKGRRDKQDRREDIRFEKKSTRRDAPDRRKRNNTWDLR
jgi:hypothetical protein